MSAAPFARHRQRRAATGATVAAALLLSGLGAWRAVEASRTPLVSVAVPPADRPSTPTPVAAALAPAPPAAGEIAAPAAGVTGTVELPALPAFAADSSTDPAIALAPARPFSMAGASGLDRARALECLTAAIYYEAASEPDAGQRAVAQVVLNRVRHPTFPATVCGVVYQGSERRGCQFSYACDGSMARVPSRAAWARAARHAAGALAGSVYAPVGLATHYHTYAVKPYWNASLVMTDVVGAHFFHRWKGWWGTPAAFRQSYAGGEPFPGPRTPVTPVAPVAPVTVAALSPIAAPPPVRLSDVPPALAESGRPLAAAPAEDRLPPAPEIVDRWKDSGKPLR